MNRLPLNTFRQRFSFAHLILTAIFSCVYYVPLMFTPNLFGSVSQTIIADAVVRAPLLAVAMMVASACILSLRCESRRVILVTGLLTISQSLFMTLTFTAAAITRTHDPARPEIWWWVTIMHMVFFWLRLHPPTITTSEVQAKLKEDITTVIDRLNGILKILREED